MPGRVALIALFVAGVALSVPSGFGAFWFVPYAGVGTLLAIRRPGTSIGWILLGLGWCFAAASASAPLPQEVYAGGGFSPVIGGVIVAISMAGATGFYLLGVLAIVFPSGRLPRGRWRTTTIAALGAGLAALVLTAVMPIINVSWGGTTGAPITNPAAVLPGLPVWQVLTADTLILPVVALMIGAAVSLVGRYRRAAGVERQQLRWMTAALAFVVVAVVGGFVVGLLVPAAAQAGVVWLGAVVAFPCVPIAVGIAVLRYRLYEIDRIISRSIGWAIVTGSLLAVFAALMVGLQAVLAGFTQGQTLAVAASTLGAFALFQPVRRRVQRAVDRRFDRSRYDGERIATTFAARLRDQVAIEAVTADLRSTVERSVNPAGACLWLRGSGS